MVDFRFAKDKVSNLQLNSNYEFLNFKMKFRPDVKRIYLAKDLFGNIRSDNVTNVTTNDRYNLSNELW